MIRKTIKVALLLLHLSFKAFTFQPKHVPTAPLQQSYLFGTRSADKMPPGQRQFSLTMSTTSSSSSSSSLFLRRKHSLGRLLKSVLSFPLRFILFGPWKLISQLILVNDVDVDDGTVSIEGNAVVDPSVVSESMASTAVIGELNDVAVVSAETKKNDLLEIVSGDIFTDAAIASHSPTVAEKAASRTTPLGERWAVAGEGVDLSGNWKVVVTEDFKKEYDEYLAKLGQPLIVRTVALGIIGRTTEDLSQTEHGRCLLIRGTNARGVWDRTLVASGTEIGVDEFDPVQIPVMVRVFKFAGSTFLRFLIFLVS